MIALCRWLIRRLASRLDSPQREWADALLAELCAVPPGRERRRWALGGVRLAAMLVLRSISRAGWWRHPGRSLALLLGAPSPASGRSRPPTPGTRAYLVALACASATGLAVLVLRGLLEDSPYLFNAGRAAPAGLHPDWANPMSLAFDLVVLASGAELLAMMVLTACFLRFRVRAGGRTPRPVRAALVASALPLWVLLASMVLFGIAAQHSAAPIFDHGPAGGDYLTWTSWVALAVVVAVSATIVTAAGLGRGRRAR